MPLSLTAPEPILPAGLPLLDRTEAAELARVHPATLQRWRTLGLLPLVRIGTRVLYRRAAVENYLSAVHDPSRQPEPPATPSHAQARQLLDLAQCREALGVSPTTLTLLVSSGELVSSRVHGRRLVRAGDLAAYVESCSEPATAGPLAGRHA